MRKAKLNPAVAKAIHLAGGGSRVAAALGVTPQAVSRWPKKLPAERVIALEALVGGAVSRSELRPDLYPREVA